jgi:hypothetical protein
MVGKPRWGAPRDQNQSEICKAANKIPGVVAEDLGASGKGVPDLLIGYRGVNYLCEVKLELVKGKVFASHSKLNDKQVEWHRDWTGQVCVIRCLDDLLSLLNL